MQDTGQKFKVGDRVTVASAPYVLDYPFTGTITRPSNGQFRGDWEVKNDDPNGYRLPSFYEKEMALIQPTPTLTPGEYAATVHPDGTVTLTPAQTAEAEVVEEKREPQVGELWRLDDARLVLIASNHIGEVRPWPIVLNHAGAGPVIADEDARAPNHMKEGRLTFAYSSLAAAVAAGEIK